MHIALEDALLHMHTHYNELVFFVTFKVPKQSCVTLIFKTKSHAIALCYRHVGKNR